MTAHVVLLGSTMARCFKLSATFLDAKGSLVLTQTTGALLAVRTGVYQF